MAGEVVVILSQREQIRRVLIHGPAFPDDVAAATGYPLRICSAALGTLWKMGTVIRSDERVKRAGGNSAYLYSLRYREWRYWTTLDQKRLRELVAYGKSPQQIARELGRTIPSIRHQAKRMGLTLATRKQTVWSNEVKMKAAAMRASRVSPTVISEELGVPLSTLSLWSTRR